MCLSGGKKGSVCFAHLAYCFCACFFLVVCFARLAARLGFGFRVGFFFVLRGWRRVLGIGMGLGMGLGLGLSEKIKGCTYFPVISLTLNASVNL